MLSDLKSLSPAKRREFADIIHDSHDFQLPDLKWFNSSPCVDHKELDDTCQACGMRLRRHQRVGAAWLFVAGRGLIADPCGTGKSGQAAAALALAKQVGELSPDARCLVVCRAAAVSQWRAQLVRMLPEVAVVAAEGGPATRAALHASPWEIMVTSFQLMARDRAALQRLPITTLVLDDIDPLRSATSQTSRAATALAARAERVMELTGTPLQKKLPELYNALALVGGREIFGSEISFKRRYVRTTMIRVFNRHTKRDIFVEKIIGYKNLSELRQRAAPLTLRRSETEIDDVEMPDLVPTTTWLEGTPGQRQQYEALRRGVLTILRKDGSRTPLMVAQAKFLRGMQICSGLAALGGKDDSAKLDWVEDKLTGDLEGEKVIVFINFRDNVRALSERLTRRSINHVVISGDDNSKRRRGEALERFWQDEDCLVLIGTSAIEQSLNLQVSRHLINVDTIMNAARMQQLAGRIRRVGSKHRTVYIHNLLLQNTQETGYLPLLRSEQALANYVWDESKGLYDSLSPTALLRLIGSS